jgi:hypothetical protein
MKESKIIADLRENLVTLEENIVRNDTAVAGRTRDDIIQKNKALLEESKDLLGTLNELRSDEPGVVLESIGKIITTIAGSSPTPSPTSSSSPQLTPCVTP